MCSKKAGEKDKNEEMFVKGANFTSSLGDNYNIFCFYRTFTDLRRPKFFEVMSRICQITGKIPITGNTVSHSNIKTKRRFLPNLQTKRYFLAEEDKWITLKISTEGIRTINKNGLAAVVKKLRAEGHKI